jgi:DNA-binding response OmpR family regulator
VARVLVVDDDPDLLTLIGAQLHQHGHRVITAVASDEALRIVDENGAPDIAVLDVTMPKMNGLALLRRLRSRKDAKELPAIFLSGRAGPKDIKAGEALGAIYLAKPYEIRDLLAAIDRLVVPAASGW